MQSQPGVREGGTLLWGVDEARRCLVAATSPDCLAAAVADGHPATEAPSAHVDAESSVYAGRNGELTTTIPKAAKPSYVPVPDGAADLLDEATIPTPDVPDPKPGMYYVAVAERHAGGTAFAFLPVPRLATAITLDNLRGDGGTFPQPLLTPSEHQARVLIDIATGHRELAAYREGLRTADEVPADVERNLLHERRPVHSPRFVRDAIDRLERLGGAALVAH
jgi:hypothetical protein